MDESHVYIKLHGKYGDGKYALVDTSDYELLRKYNWFMTRQGYVIRHSKDGNIYLHKYILESPKGMVTDHINRNKLDNRRVNLRICTYSENSINQDFIRKKQFPQVSSKNLPRGVRPVRKNKNGDLYDDRWQVKFRDKHIGIFYSIEDAADAYDKVALEYFGDRAVLNI